MCYVFGILFRLFVPGDFVALEADPWGCIRYLVFPALAIAIPRAAMTVKMLRSSVAKELRQDYVYTAQSRGNSRTAILMRHVLRNALIPAITFLAVSMAEILTGSIIIEQVFTIPRHWAAAPGQHFQPGFPRGTGGGGHFGRLDRGRELLADLLNQWTDPRVRLR